MKQKELISIPELCSLFDLEISFFSELGDLGLLQFTTIEEIQFIHSDAIQDAEKMIRLHRDLQINPEGIDVVFNLLRKVETLNEELIRLRNRLRLYEGD